RVGTYSEEDGSYRNSKHLALVPHCSEEGSLPDGGGKVMNRVEQHKSAFHERVDRHGNSFGARAATKQTRVPPPTRTLEKSRGESHNWRSKASERAPEPQGYSSPPYTMRRDIVRETNFPRKNSFPQKGLGEWRMKPATLTCSERAHGPLLEVTQEQTRQETPKGHTEEQITEDLNEATRLYLSCPDPTEAAARRHRVLAGDIRNQTEETATGLMRLLLTRRSNKSPEDIYSGRLNSIVVSPEVRIEEGNTISKEVLEVADDKDTLLNFQNKTKKKRADKFRIRSPRLSPNILRGVSLKKRKFSQIQHSPINGRKCLSGAPSKNHLSSGVTRRGDAVEKGSILLTKNPAIQLIPAMSRKKQDSRGSPSKQNDAMTSHTPDDELIHELNMRLLKAYKAEED
ncbi:hypothetical protein HID58_084171, partial [Brassica napus]